MEPTDVPVIINENIDYDFTIETLINEDIKKQLNNNDENTEDKIARVDLFFNCIAMEVNSNYMDKQAQNKAESQYVSKSEDRHQTDDEPKKKQEKKRLVYIKWNDISHLQLWHNNEEESMIHFPWAHMSCALDSTLSAYWVIYLRLQLKSEWLKLFREEFPKIIAVFDELYERKIHNIKAKEKLRDLLEINDGRWKRRESVEVLLITDFLKNNLSAIHTNGEESLLQWVFKVHWLCEPCGTQTCQKHAYGNYINTDQIHKRDNIAFMPRSSKFTVHDSIGHFLSDTVRNRSCDKCMLPCTIFRETIIHPYILHLSYPFLGKGVKVDLPHFVDEELLIEEVVYDLVGVIYGDGFHFVFRFLKDGKVYEADGMQQHSTSKHKKIVRSALSREIPGCHKISLAGHIDWELNVEKELVEGKKIVDIYYLKREN